MLLFMSSPILSQTKPQELFDMLTSLTIAKSETGNTVAWKNLTAKSTAIKWKEKIPVRSGKLSRQTGTALVLINGKKFVCVDENKQEESECKWMISFQGSATAYDRIEFSTSNFPVNEAGDEIKMLFPKNAASFKLKSKCQEGASFWRNLYEVNIPGNKPFWMVSSFESMSGTASQYESSGVANNFYVGFFLNRQTAEDECAN